MEASNHADDSSNQAEDSGEENAEWVNDQD